MGGTLHEVEDGTKKAPRIFSKRYLLSYLLFSGTFCLYIMRTNITVAIVCMTNDGFKDNNTEGGNITSTSPKDDCPQHYNGGDGTAKQGEFDWDRSVRGFILSSFYIGYFVTQFPAGLVSKRVGCKNLILIGMTILCIATLLTPICARTNVYLLIVIQIIKGGASGLYYPSLNQLLGFWATSIDRSTLFSIAYSGSSIGSVLSSIFSGLLCEHGFDGGWPSIFYIYGAVSAFWCLAWFFLAHETPADHPGISHEEREYIVNSLGKDGGKEKKKSLSVPWTNLLTSPPFYAMLVLNFVYSWGWYTALNVLPQYMKDVLRFNISANGLFNSLPYLCNFILTILGSILADAILRRQALSLTRTRKLLTSLGTLPPVILAIVVGFMNCHQVPLAVTMLTFWVGAMGFSRSGSLVNAIDLAPAYAGVINGIDQTLNTLPGIAAPTITGLLTPEGKPEQWRNVFFLGAGIMFVGWFVYMIFADGQEQEWAKRPKTEQDMETPPIESTSSKDTIKTIDVNDSQYINAAFEIESWKF